MKWNIWLLVLLVVGVVLFYLLRPARKYNWEPTFYHQSEEPFGCKLFDEMAAATMPKGYTYSDDDPEELLKSEGGMALLIINEGDYMSDWNYKKIQQLDDFVSRGNKLMIVTDNLYVNRSEAEEEENDDEEADVNSLSNDFLFLDINHDYYFDLNVFRLEVNNKLKDSIIWTLSSTDTVNIYKSLIENCFSSYPEDYETLAEVHEKLYLEDPLYLHPRHVKRITSNSTYDKYDYDDEEEYEYDEEDEYEDEYEYDDEDEYDDNNELHYNEEEPYFSAVALRHKIGKGTFYIHCNPLLFTNYGVLNHDISLYLNHAMTELADCQVVRMPADKFKESVSGGGQEQESTTPLSFMLSRPPLRWALYTILAALLLFMFFTARRRQRVIPVIKQPENRNLQFVKLISSIYYHQGDRHDLLRKKYTYFKDELRRILQMDIEDHKLLSNNIQTLSQLTNIEEQVIKSNLVNIPFYIDESNYLEKEDMMNFIDFMNNLLKKL